MQKHLPDIIFGMVVLGIITALTKLVLYPAIAGAATH